MHAGVVSPACGGGQCETPSRVIGVRTERVGVWDNTVYYCYCVLFCHMVSLVVSVFGVIVMLSVA